MVLSRKRDDETCQCGFHLRWHGYSSLLDLYDLPHEKLLFGLTKSLQCCNDPSSSLSHLQIRLRSHLFLQHPHHSTHRHCRNRCRWHFRVSWSLGRLILGRGHSKWFNQETNLHSKKSIKTNVHHISYLNSCVRILRWKQNYAHSSIRRFRCDCGYTCVSYNNLFLTIELLCLWKKWIY